MITDFQTETNRFATFGVPPEKIKWRGRPDAGLHFSKADIFMVPFSLLWCGFAIFWEASVLRSDAPPLFRIWGVPFVLVGIYIVIGRFFWDAYSRSNTWYALTDDSALIVRRGLGGGMSSIYLPTVDNLGLDLRADGSGTIYFGAASDLQPGGMGLFGRSTKPDTPAFRYIPDAARVFQQCQNAQRPAAALH